ncbi:MAG: AzlC family ABC transporter permease [Bdellovibrionota bacterium]|nr:AzlC family ABC transporter permease [Bdellovibrionota bacterium]
MFAYIPVGVSFGLLLANTGLNWPYALLFSGLVYAGAAQFMAIGLIATKASLLEVALSTFFLNVRHVFYGLSLMGFIKGGVKKNIYSIFGLTDETYSLLATGLKDKAILSDEIPKITLLNQTYWVFGSLLGNLFGEAVQVKIKGLEFILTALFIVLSYEQFKKNPSKKSLFVSVLGAFFFYLFLPKWALLLSLVFSFSYLSINYVKPSSLKKGENGEENL